jgi:NADH oxidase (H2O2-forming)
MNRKIVIIGGGAGGGTAAQFARKTDRKASITIFEAGRYSQYSKCALPYLISKIVDNVVEFGEEWFERANIELLLETVVESVESKKIIGRRGSETIERSFDSLIIATGAESVIPPIKGMKKDSVFSLRNLDDARAISSLKIKRALIIGAGSIGLEMAEALYHLDVKVTVIELLPFILPSMLDKDMADILERNIPKDIEILTNCRVIEVIEKKNAIFSAIVEDEEKNRLTIDTDMVLVSAGIRANTKLAESIGCKIGERGGIVIDDRCQTSVENVYAVGDCTEYLDFVTGKPFLVGLGSIAVRQGIVAGINAAGGDVRLPRGFLQTRTSKLFGIEVAAVGPTSRLMEREPITGRFRGRTLPEYFPGGEEVTVKVLVDPEDGTIVGAQTLGEGAALRANVFACAIMNKTSVNRFVQMETAYAPPIAPALDPITVACDVARKKLSRR